MKARVRNIYQRGDSVEGKNNIFMTSTGLITVFKMNIEEDTVQGEAVIQPYRCQLQ